MCLVFLSLSWLFSVYIFINHKKSEFLPPTQKMSERNRLMMRSQSFNVCRCNCHPIVPYFLDKLTFSQMSYFYRNFMNASITMKSINYNKLFSQKCKRELIFKKTVLLLLQQFNRRRVTSKICSKKQKQEWNINFLGQIKMFFQGRSKSLRNNNDPVQNNLCEFSKSKT